MASSYPGALDALTNPGTSDPMNAPSHSGQHTNANDAIEAIEAELGTAPSAAYATVAARLTAIEAALGGGGLSLMVPTSVAGSASLTGGKIAFTGDFNVNGCFSSSFDVYRLIIDYTQASGTGVRLRWRVSGADDTASLYSMEATQADGTSQSNGRTSLGTGFTMYYGRAAGRSAWTAEIFNPGTALETSFVSMGIDPYPVSTSGAIFYCVAGRHSAATAWDGFSLATTGGAIAGTARVFGYQLS